VREGERRKRETERESREREKEAAAGSCYGVLRVVGSSKSYVCFAEYSLFYRALLQKRPML